MLNFKEILDQEENLDPNDWNQMKQLGYQMVDDMMEYLRTIGERPVWTEPSESSKTHMHKGLPQMAEPIEQIYQEFRTHILPYNKGNVHPRFWAWVQGTGTPFAMLAEMLAAGMNPNLGIGDHAAMYVENQVIDWCKEMLGFPMSASGLLVSGGSIANITGILVARNAFDERIRKEGVRALPGQLVLYASSETHSCQQKAVEVAGLGADALRKVPVNADFQIDITKLRQMIAEDKAAGKIPFCIVGNAGTVNTGAIDPLDEILQVCKEEKLWFHVDGAFGALAKLAPEFQDSLRAMEEADSVAFDLHKWLYLPYEVGCVLIKNAQVHRDSFAMQPNYLLKHERGLSAGPDPLSNYGMELSRGFKALKVWMSFKEHGIAKFARLIRQNIAQAFYLGDLVNQASSLELLAPVTMNITCFRYNPGHLSQEQLNVLNKEILMRLHEEGVAAPSYTMLNGNYAIRVANVNHRSQKTDFQALAAGVVRIGQEVSREINVAL